MNKTKIIERLKNLNVNYQEKLEAFFKTYLEMVHLAEEKISEEKTDFAGLYTVQKLQEWIEKEGYNLFYSSMANMKNDLADRVEGFIEYYSFLLVSSVDDGYNLIDLLFAIPEEFAKEFANNKAVYVIEDWEDSLEYEKILEPRYVFCTTGTRETVPCFI